MTEFFHVYTYDGSEQGKAVIINALVRYNITEISWLYLINIESNYMANGV